MTNSYKGIRNEFFCIATYDVNEIRVGKVHKLFKQFMYHNQNSVFIGPLMKADFVKLHTQLQLILNPQEDVVCFWMVKTEGDLKEVSIGCKKKEDELFY